MYALFVYSLKAGACLAVFYLFFKLLLSRETLHRFNRFVVLAGMVLAFLLPLCVVTVYRELPAPLEIALSEADFSPVVVAAEEPSAFDWEHLLGGLFIAGAAAMLVWTGRSFWGMFRVIRSGRHERLDSGTILVRVPQAVTPFSWGRYVVVSEEDLALAGREILLHEEAHLRLRHSVDLLLSDLAGCLQWFNPAMWLLRRELRAIHEYEADRAVLRSGVEARDYQLLLIRKAVGGRWYSVANSFNHSKLKNRITMMLRKESSRWTGVKALFVLPLSAVAVGAFARTAYVVPDDKVTKESVTVAISEPNISLRRLNSEPPAQPDNSAPAPTYVEDEVVVVGFGTVRKPAEGAPLYIVDGQEVSSLDDLDPARIASINVYKDAETVAPYGKKAENGVVVITTKSAARTAGTVNSIRLSDDRKIAIDGSRPTGKTLYLVDGIPVDGIDDLKAEDIDNILVVKDRVPEKYRKQGYGSMTVITTKEGASASYFQSDEWKEARRQLEKVDVYFDSDEWKKAQQQIADAAEQAAAAGSSLNGQVLSIRADRYTEKPESSGVTHSTGRITLSETEGIPDDCLIFINGRCASKDDLAAIPAGKIRRMSIYKGQQAVDKFGPEATHGAIDIKAKGFKNK